MNDGAEKEPGAGRRDGVGPAAVALIVMVTILLTLGGSYWFLTTYVFAREFQPVHLDAGEERKLDHKLRLLGYQPDGSPAAGGRPAPTDAMENEGGRDVLEPQPYTEKGARREISFNERELNALLAHKTDLARRLAIDLSRDLISAKLLLPMDPDFPLLGGKTLRLNAGVEMAYVHGRPVVVLKGISIMGVPMPNAWLGGLKNVDLVSEFGAAPGFWKSFADGVEDIRVEDGRVKVKLKE